MRGVKQGIRSTKQRRDQQTVTLESGEELTIPLTKHNDVFLRVGEARETMYTDQTGAFPVQSQRGHKYIMVLCEIDNNIIMSEPMRSRSSGEMVKAF